MFCIVQYYFEYFFKYYILDFYIPVHSIQIQSIQKIALVY